MKSFLFLTIYKNNEGLSIIEYKEIQDWKIL